MIEIPCPARPLRVEFFRRKCPDQDEPTIDRLAAQTERGIEKVASIDPLHC